MTTTRRVLAAAASVIATVLAGEALSIVVAPTAVYMTDAAPSANLTLFNPSNVPEEVSIEAVFGYPATDESGTLRLHLDAEGGDPSSAADWVRAYPSRVVVPPGGRQVVRILAEPPSELADGEYWARLVVTSRGQRIAVDASSANPEVQVGLDLEVRTLVPLTFRKGPVSTGIRMEELAPAIEGDSLLLRPRLVREGNAAYIGALTVELLDNRGQTVREWTEQIAAYRDYHRLLSYDVADIPAGNYSVRARLSTSARGDVPGNFRLPSTAVEQTAEVIRR